MGYIITGLLLFGTAAAVLVAYKLTPSALKKKIKNFLEVVDN